MNTYGNDYAIFRNFNLGFAVTYFLAFLFFLEGSYWGATLAPTPALKWALPKKNEVIKKPRLEKEAFQKQKWVKIQIQGTPLAQNCPILIDHIFGLLFFC